MGFKEIENIIEIREPTKRKAFSLQTPHSGRHFVPSHRAYWRRWGFIRRIGRRIPLLRRLLLQRHRFMEGWYYRLTLPEHKNVSFAFIISIEDPGRIPPSPLRLACIQIVGPHDSYLIQADQDDAKFWAWQHQQALGCTFSWMDHVTDNDTMFSTALHPDSWRASVESGFQIMPTHWLGRIRGHDGSEGLFQHSSSSSSIHCHAAGHDGAMVDGQDTIRCASTTSCDFDFTVIPVCGYGDATEPPSRQKSTGGWLSYFGIFEPHWQVTMANGRATGSICWRNTSYHFHNAPFYAEKNWGAALPMKWFWTQCNNFDNYPNLTVTAGGGIRKVPLGQTETLGMVTVHYNGLLFEGVPWTGTMGWHVSTWGLWQCTGRATTTDRPFEVVVTYKCDPTTTPGLIFRAPTPDQGMIKFGRDTFEATTELTLWELEWDDTTKDFQRKAGPPLIDRARSDQGGAEVGGGPWWDDWVVDSRLKKPIEALLQLPYRVNKLRKIISRNNHRRGKG